MYSMILQQLLDQKIVFTVLDIKYVTCQHQPNLSQMKHLKVKLLIDKCLQKYCLVKKSCSYHRNNLRMSKYMTMMKRQKETKINPLLFYFQSNFCHNFDIPHRFISPNSCKQILTISEKVNVKLIFHLDIYEYIFTLKRSLATFSNTYLRKYLNLHNYFNKVRKLSSLQR